MGFQWLTPRHHGNTICTETHPKKKKKIKGKSTQNPQALSKQRVEKGELKEKRVSEGQRKIKRERERERESKK